MFGVRCASVVGLQRALSRTPREVFPADHPTSTVSAALLKARRPKRPGAGWPLPGQLEIGAAATTTALDPAPTRNRQSRGRSPSRSCSRRSRRNPALPGRAIRSRRRSDARFDLPRRGCGPAGSWPSSRASHPPGEGSRSGRQRGHPRPTPEESRRRRAGVGLERPPSGRIRELVAPPLIRVTSESAGAGAGRSQANAPAEGP